MPGRQDPEQRRREIAQFRQATKGVYLVFLSERTLADPLLRQHVEEEVRAFPNSTILCWIGKRPDSALFEAAPADHRFEFGASGALDSSHANKADDLMVRLFWVFHKYGLGVPMEQMRRLSSAQG